MSNSLVISYFTNSQIDKVRWDDAIEKASNGMVYAYSWYLDAVFPNWSALISENFEYVFPITINSKFGLSYWYSPIYTMQLGVFSSNEITNETIHSFFLAIPKKIASIDFSVNPSQLIIPKGFTSTLKKCQVVYLSATYQDLQQRYSSNLKRNLSKANKAELRIEESTDITSVVELFKAHRGIHLHKVTQQDYGKLYQLIESALKVKKGFIYTVYQGDLLLASCFFSMTNNRIIYHKGGVNEIGKKLGAMHFLIDFLIEKYAESSYTLDFGGSTIEAVKRFNQNFSKDEYVFLQLQRGSKMINVVRKWRDRFK